MADTVHPIAASGFAAAADAYERGRPDYPAQAVAAIVHRLDLGPGRVLLELGAGTGKLTRQLVPSGARILALEPVEGMRAKLAAVVPGAQLVGGTAESIPLDGQSVDAVVVAQAFHWFDAIRALSEIHRVLRPGGRVALVWNRRDRSVPWVRTFGDLVDRLEGDAPRTWTGQWRSVLERCALFTPFVSETFRHVQRLTPAGVLDRAASVSFVAAASPADRETLLAQLGALLREDPATAGRAEVDLPYDTEVLWAETRRPVPGDTGVVATVNANQGGVPKPTVDGARVLRAGLEGDGHAEPEPIHGGPEQAVCLYAQEAIERVRADGHAAFPGAFGENLVLLGIDWAALRPGDRLAFGAAGDGVLLELTKPAAPCQTIAQWFEGRRIARIAHSVHPEDARWYARVLREGAVAPGTAVRVVPGELPSRTKRSEEP